MQKAVMLALIVTAVLALVAMQSVNAEDSVASTNYYAAYYDGHYGSIADGYWDRHGKYFWFKDRGGLWHRDDGAHFQRDAAVGFTVVYGSGAPRMH